jgi:hypothetical protein
MHCSCSLLEKEDKTRNSCYTLRPTLPRAATGNLAPARPTLRIPYAKVLARPIKAVPPVGPSRRGGRQFAAARRALVHRGRCRRPRRIAEAHIGGTKGKIIHCRGETLTAIQWRGAYRWEIVVVHLVSWRANRINRRRSMRERLGSGSTQCGRAALRSLENRRSRSCIQERTPATSQRASYQETGRERTRMNREELGPRRLLSVGVEHKAGHGWGHRRKVTCLKRTEWVELPKQRHWREDDWARMPSMAL